MFFYKVRLKTVFRRPFRLRPPYLPGVNGIRRNKHGEKLLMYDPEQIG